MQTRVALKAGPHAIGVTFVDEDRRVAADALAAVSVDARSGGLGRGAAIRDRHDQRPVQGRRARATRRAAAASSRAGRPPTPPQRPRRPAPGRSSRRSRGAPTAGRSTTPTWRPCWSSIRPAAPRAASTAASSWRSSASCRIPSSCSGPKGTLHRRRRAVVSRQRSRAGVAPLVLPLEQRSRRRAAGRGGTGSAEGAAGPRAPGAAHAGRLARVGAGRQLRRAMAVSAEPAQRRSPSKDAFPDFDDNLRQALQRETELFIEHVMKRGPQRPGAADRRLHVRQRAPGAALRHPQRLRDAVPPRAGHRATPAVGCWVTAAS